MVILEQSQIHKNDNTIEAVSFAHVLFSIFRVQQL